MNPLEMFLGLAGGLSLFLLGMNSMGNGLETACGNKMKNILKKLTSNRFVGVLVGMIVTAIIQSSSATTVMIVGFVNAGMMTLSQAIWVIMGANIGTTITGMLIALDVGLIAPIFAIIGVVMMTFVKKPLANEIGKILAGFGILFIGMDMMSSAMEPLRNFEPFTNLMTSFSNPLLGIIVGAIFTAIIQSSSASVGILQALAMSGAITLKSAVFVLFGMNIGTCITALLASIGTNRNAKRTTLIHFMFNVFGTIMFTLICVLFPKFITFMEELTLKPALQIANMHTIFNIVTTILLLPFGLYLVKLAEKIMPDKVEKEESIFMYLSHDKKLRIGNSSLHIENLKKEVVRMYEITRKSITTSFDKLINKDFDSCDEIIKNEELIDKLNEGIIKHITVNLQTKVNLHVSEIYSAYLNISSDIERLSDHVVNIVYEIKELIDKNINLSEETVKEINIIKEVIIEMLDKTLDNKMFNNVKVLENRIDDLTDQFRDNTFNRLGKSICTAEGSIVYSTLLINFERIGDHLLNIAEHINSIKARNLIYNK